MSTPHLRGSCSAAWVGMSLPSALPTRDKGGGPFVMGHSPECHSIHNTATLWPGPGFSAGLMGQPDREAFIGLRNPCPRGCLLKSYGCCYRDWGPSCSSKPRCRKGQVVVQLSGDLRWGAVGTPRTATAQLHTLVARVRAHCCQTFERRARGPGLYGKSSSCFDGKFIHCLD